MFICFRCSWCSNLASCSSPVKCDRGEDLPCFLCDYLDSDCPNFVLSQTRVPSFYDSLDQMRKEVSARYGLGLS